MKEHVSSSGPSAAPLDEASARAEAQRFRDDADALARELGRHVVGLAPVVDGVIATLFAGGHALLEGAPGLGKTLLVRALAGALDVSFARVQFTPDLMPTDIVGATILVDDERGRRFTFARGPVFAHVLLADEINRATPKTQSALLEAMQEQSVTAGGQTHAIEAPFLVLATQNPIEMEGTYPLPEAELDRFMMKLDVPPPARDELHGILDRTLVDAVPTPSAVLTRERVLAMRHLVRCVPTARPVQDFIVRLVQATHPALSTIEVVKRFVRYGASPRGAQAIVLAARVRALRAGRFSPSFADARAVVVAALRHRVLINFEGESEGLTTDALLSTVLGAVPDVEE